PQERQLIAELFDRLAALESTPRDPDAERAIAEGLARAPHATYPLVQTVLVQDEALKRANARIAELEGQLEGQGAYDPGLAPNVSSPWGDASNSDLARQAGIDNIGHDRAGFFGGGNDEGQPEDASGYADGNEDSDLADSDFGNDDTGNA